MLVLSYKKKRIIATFKTNILISGYFYKYLYEEQPFTGTGTKFGAYLSPSPTLFKHKMNIYWPIMKNKMTNN